MKYVKRINNKLFFGKAWPSKLQAVIGRKQFTYPLGSVEQTEAQVTAQVVLALKEYDVKVRMATNSDTEDYHQNEIDILVEANLRRMKQSRGTPQFKTPDQHIIDHYDNDTEPAPADEVAEFGPTVPTVASHEFIRTKGQLASSLVPELDDIIHKEQTGQRLTMREKAASATWVALQTKAKKRPKMLYDQWKVYTNFKRLDTHTRNWNRFCGLIQNRSLNLSDQGHMELSKELSQTLRDFRDVRLTEVKIATVKRELNSIRACLNFVNKENDFDWRLRETQLPTAAADAVQERKPLSLAHQRQLVAYCLSPEHSSEPCATMALLYLQGGVMPSEVGRMDTKMQLECLSSELAPYVKIEGQLKTKYRRRPVPVVLGLSVVRDNIEKTIAWANVAKSTRIGQMKRFIDAATGTKDVYVSHGLRHSFSMNCRLSNCRDDDKATLGGWASYGAASAVSKDYGADGTFDQSNIERLYKVSLDIHRNLL
tara:strand:- start:864 stop:2312 length:1449 start_codon:yes stop_codon:yes gene_type:complete